MLRRLPWIALSTTVLVLASALVAVAPIRSAATHEELEGASLTFAPAYLVASPLFDILDTMSLLTVGQHIALLVTAIVVYASWRVWRRRYAARRSRPLTVKHRGWGRALLREVAFAGLFLLALLAVYAFGAMVQRPMAALRIRDLDSVVIDVHAHTEYSHDGRPGWTAKDVRQWHAASGFDVAYITDHRSYRGAEEGVAANPSLAGNGLVILSGLEVVYGGERVNVLSAGRVFRGLTTDNLWDIDTLALALGSLIPGREPVIVQTIPADLTRIKPAGGPGTPGIRAIEIVDGAPRGLSQVRRQRQRILRLADSLDLALVAGSNNHGWGRTAPGWTVMRIRGWRAMPPDDLARAIESTIRDGRRRATIVIERRVAATHDGLLLALTVPLVTWRMLTALSSDQRVMWLVWAWALSLGGLFVRRWRARRA